MTLPVTWAAMLRRDHAIAFAAGIAGIVMACALFDAAAHAALAQGTPFGAPRPAAADPQIGGVIGWLLEKQAGYYREFSTILRAARTDGSAVWTLLGVAFLYGVFHAAGPGHGKAVIASYLLANEQTARRGIALSFASAMLQASVAVLIVGIGAWLLNATARTMCSAERVVEIASYALIAAMGVRLVWVKGGGFIGALQRDRSPALAMAHAGRSHHHHGQDQAHHDHHHHAAHGEPGHVHDARCGHNHGPTPDQLAGPGGWQRGLGAIFAAGLRPCSGAILVLVFALAQGLFWAGIAATFVMGLGTAITVAVIAVIAVSAKGLARKIASGREGGGALVLRGLEFGAAGLVLLLGIGLLAGYVAAERATCF